MIARIRTSAELRRCAVDLMVLDTGADAGQIGIETKDRLREGGVESCEAVAVHQSSRCGGFEC